MRACIFLALLATRAPGQEFDAASFRLVPGSHMGRVKKYDGKLMGNSTMLDLIADSYGLPRWDILDAKGRSWSKVVGDFQPVYRLEAVFPKNTPPEQAMAMLRNLLAERMGLRCHRETREVDGYAFTGHVRPSSSVEFVGQTEQALLMNQKFQDAGSLLSETTATTMGRFVEHMSIVLAVPIVDQTDLGAQPVKIRWVQDMSEGVGKGADGYRVALLNALSTLGIKFQRTKMSREVLIVDSVSKEPTEN